MFFKRTVVSVNGEERRKKFYLQRKRKKKDGKKRVYAYVSRGTGGGEDVFETDVSKNEKKKTEKKG